MRHCWNIMDNMSHNSYQPYLSNFSYYPEYLDKDFNQKIYKKKEFYINKIKTKKITKDQRINIQKIM